MATAGSIARTNRAMLETTMTAEEATAEARKKWDDGGRWTSKRFRLEGSRGGNSRLVSRKTAEGLQRQHGGHVVELVPVAPKRPKERKLSKNEERAEGLPHCPKCGASAGAACTANSTGKLRPPHRDRQLVANAVNAARGAELAQSIAAG